MQAAAESPGASPPFPIFPWGDAPIAAAFVLLPYNDALCGRSSVHKAERLAVDIVWTIICATIVLGFLVFIHEGGHFLTARAFGVRVTEFMLGMPGPSIGFTRGETRFGVTCVPLGGYARVCGMEGGEMSPHLEPVLASLWRRGTAVMEDVARDCNISEDAALEALDELVEWGSAVAPLRKDEYNTYRTPAFKPTKRQIRCAEAKGLPAPASYKLGEPRPVDDAHATFEAEYRQQYRALPFWKRSLILLAGPGVNLLFTILAFIVLYSIIGFDVSYTDTGEVVHVTVDPLRALEAGFAYIGAVVQAVASLFNPATAADTVSQSTSIVGIAVMSRSAFEAGFSNVLTFMAMISVSLGIMNLLPIPPLDGGKFVIEIIQKLRGRALSQKVVGYVSMAGLALFLGFFAIMLNQDIQRFVFGNWG